MPTKVDWDLYARLLGNGRYADNTQVAIQQAVDTLTQGMVEDPAYQADAIVDGVNVPLLASRTSALKCAIKAVPGSDIHIGDLIECLGTTWIVVELYADKLGFVCGEMWICNQVINFYNSSPLLHSKHCVVNNGTYYRDSSNAIAFMPSNMYEIYMSIDNDTRQLFIDKRLALGVIFSPTGEEVLEVCRIIGIDMKSKNCGDGSHLMVLTVQRDVYDQHVDSLEDNVCDVVANGEEVVIPDAAGSCVISGGDTLRIGISRSYTASFVDQQGNAVDTVAQWTVSAPDGVDYVVDGNTCVIRTPLDNRFVGQLITLSVADDAGLYGTCEKKVRVITIG